MKTGIYYRIYRNGKYRSVELEDMSLVEVESLVSSKSTIEMAMLIFHLTQSIKYFNCGGLCVKYDEVE